MGRLIFGSYVFMKSIQFSERGGRGNCQSTERTVPAAAGTCGPCPLGCSRSWATRGPVGCGTACPSVPRAPELSAQSVLLDVQMLFSTAFLLQLVTGAVISLTPGCLGFVLALQYYPSAQLHPQCL